MWKEIDIQELRTKSFLFGDFFPPISCVYLFSGRKFFFSFFKIELNYLFDVSVRVKLFIFIFIFSVILRSLLFKRNERKKESEMCLVEKYLWKNIIV